MLFLRFELGKDRYALDIREVAEVLPLVRGPASYLGPMSVDARGVIQRIDVTQLLPVSVRDVLFNELAARS